MSAAFLLLIAHTFTLLHNDLRRKGERNDILEAANFELDAFNYTVAHDLKKPLTTMVGYAELVLELGRPQLDEQLQGYLQKIRDGSLNMGKLIEALLDFSSAVRHDLQCGDTDLSAIATGIVAQLQLEEPERHVQVRISPAIRVWGDPVLLETMLSNLLGNAWKYTRTTPDARIALDLSRQGNGQVLCVRDNGIGFDAAQAKQIFTPFCRLRGTEEFSGFGIGLATVKRIVERHGGQIWAEAESGSGAAFCFTLPLPAAELPRTKP